MSNDTQPTRVTTDRPPFSQIPRNLTRDTTLSLSARVVYDDLMSRADDGDDCFPGIRTIATDIGVSTSTAQKAVNDLEAAGWITVTRMGKKKHGPEKGQRQSNRYHLHLEPVAEIATPTSRNTRRPRSDNRDVIRTTELDPVNKTQLAAKPRNAGWDFLTDPNAFNLATGTTAQQKRVGRLANDINSTMDHNEIPDHDRPAVLAAAARSWPQHFQDATLTPDAYAKHLAALMRPPLRGNQQATKHANRAAADAELIARMG